MLQKSRSHLKIIDTRKFHTEDPQILGATPQKLGATPQKLGAILQKLGATAVWRPGFAHLCDNVLKYATTSAMHTHSWIRIINNVLCNLRSWNSVVKQVILNEL